MNQIQSVEELTGKTITHTHQMFEELWLRFSDGSFVWFRASHCYDSTELELVSTRPNLAENSMALLALESATPEDVENFHKAKRGMLQAEQERFEKEQLAKLLAKYPQK